MPAQTLIRNPKKIPSGDAALRDYEVVRERVRETLLIGQRKIELQKVLTYFETGKYLDGHILLAGNSAERYGGEVVEKLANDLDVSDTLLYQCLQGYRAFKILYARTISFPLTWAHYRAAMRIADERERLALVEQAAKEDWNSREMEVVVRNRRWAKRISGPDDKKPAPLPLVCLGPFYTYKVIQPESIHSQSKEMLLDMGFGYVVEMSLFPKVRFPVETIVTGVQDKFTLIKAEAADEESLYTYKAYVRSVIDGDTLKLEFELGFGGRRRETIRLNYIDCPEMDTPEGRAAKKFVEKELSACEFITVKSIRTRQEKWGRYLGDVFFQRKGKGPLIYLNQLLLDKGHAVRVKR